MSEQGGHPKGDATRVVSAGRRPEWTQGIVNAPVWRASTILYGSVAELRAAGGRDTHHRLFYGRRGTPTQWSLGRCPDRSGAGRRGAPSSIPPACAAIAAALLSVLSPGDELLLPDSAYDPTRSMGTGLLKRMGIATRFYDPLIGAGIADLIGDKTRAIFMESPGSLTFEVQDVPAIVAAAKARGIVTLLDNTWATPLFFPAIERGIDLLDPRLHQIYRRPFGRDARIGHRRARAFREAARHQLPAWPDRQPGRLLARLARPAHARHPPRPASVERAEDRAVAEGTARGCRGVPPGLARLPRPRPVPCATSRDRPDCSPSRSKDATEEARAALIDGLEHFGIGYSWGGFESLALPVDPARYRTATRRRDAGAAGAAADRHRGSGGSDPRSRRGARALPDRARMNSVVAWLQMQGLATISQPMLVEGADCRRPRARRAGLRRG